MPAIERAIQRCADPARAKILASFFKTGSGEYGEGDVFLGLTVPVCRGIAKQYKDLPQPELKKLLRSPVHEKRLIALLILVERFEKGTLPEKDAAFSFYVRFLSSVNNWDLVDLSAPRIVGAYLDDKPKTLLNKWSRSAVFWERRIAIVSTYWFIRKNRFGETLKLAKRYLTDKEDLIFKATGWMLREIGKRDSKVLEGFLERHCRKMPRTMLRYAIERFPEAKRRIYLSS